MSHINSADTTTIKGAYRGTMQGTHYFNQKTGQWVFVDSNKKFVSGWKLSEDQASYLMKRRNVA